METTTNSPEETQKLAKNFAKSLKNGDVVLLYGDLGSGKTQFFKGLAKGLGIKERVTSPTFVFIKTYKVGKRIINHVDLYRAEKSSDLEEIGIEEIMSNDAITVIEWADRLEGRVPKKRIDVLIEPKDEKRRKIRITRH